MVSDFIRIKSKDLDITIKIDDKVLFSTGNVLNNNNVVQTILILSLIL
jgi:hypothetical protein